MDEKRAQKIIFNAVNITRPTWSQFKQWSWKEIDRVFIQHGYEQLGFRPSKFIPLLEKRGIFSIYKLGAILLDQDQSDKYNRKYAGSRNSEFYIKLRECKFGEEGKLFEQAVKEFLEDWRGNYGACFWRLLWYLLYTCAILRKNYNSSFKEYIIKKYEAFSNQKNISESKFLSLTANEWENFLEKAKPWRELKGIGRNMFEYIFRDIKEAKFAKNAYKLDSANKYFLKVTGISKLIKPFNKNKIVDFLNKLEMKYSIKEINQGIYTYCSKTHKEKYGFCKDLDKCKECNVYRECEKNFCA